MPYFCTSMLIVSSSLSLSLTVMIADRRTLNTDRPLFHKKDRYKNPQRPLFYKDGCFKNHDRPLYNQDGHNKNPGRPLFQRKWPLLEP